MSRASTDYWGDFSGRNDFLGYRGRTFTPRNSVHPAYCPENPYYISKVRPREVVVRPLKFIYASGKLLALTIVLCDNMLQKKLH